MNAKEKSEVGLFSKSRGQAKSERKEVDNAEKDRSYLAKMTPPLTCGSSKEKMPDRV